MKLYVVGKYLSGKKNTSWMWGGLFTTRELARAQCKSWRDFYFRVPDPIDHPVNPKRLKPVPAVYPIKRK